MGLGLVKNDKKENDKADTDLLLKLTATKNSTPEGVRELGTCKHIHIPYNIESILSTLIGKNMGTLAIFFQITQQVYFSNFDVTSGAQLTISIALPNN